MWPRGSSGAPHSGQGGRPAPRPAPRGDERRARRRRSCGRGAGRGRPRPRRHPRRDRSASPSSSWARASTRTRSAPPSQPSVSDPARNASLSGSSSGSPSTAAFGGLGVAARRRLGDAPQVELVEERTEPLGEHRDLDLLERHRDDATALAGLEEERPIARLADRAGDEPVGRVEDVAASGHASTLYRIPRAVGSAGASRPGR